MYIYICSINNSNLTLTSVCVGFLGEAQFSFCTYAILTFIGLHISKVILQNHIYVANIIIKYNKIYIYMELMPPYVIYICWANTITIRTCSLYIIT